MFNLHQDPTRGTHQFGLTLVGHSLGAGTAAILAILMRQEYPDLVCFSFAPPGGLLSMPAQQHTQEFITSVVYGKDVVPRLGLRQMESLRADLINAIKRSVDPKVRILSSHVTIKEYDLSDIHAFFYSLIAVEDDRMFCNVLWMHFYPNVSGESRSWRMHQRISKR